MTVPLRACRGVRIVALAALAGLAAGCFSSGPHTVPKVEFEGRQYDRRGLADIPAADLRPVGTAALTEVDDVTDPTVLALRDVEPTLVIVLRLDPSKAERPTTGPAPRPYAVLGGPGLEQLPEEVCRRYFDPREEASPVECQVPITVVFDGRRYRALEPFVAKAGPAGLRFKASDVTAAGALSDIDPRLYEVNPAGHVIRGVDPTEAIVVVRGAGEKAEYLPFVAESLSRTPASLCRFRDTEDPDAAEARPTDCPRPNATP